MPILGRQRSKHLHPSQRLHLSVNHRGHHCVQTDVAYLEFHSIVVAEAVASAEIGVVDVVAMLEVVVAVAADTVVAD